MAPGRFTFTERMALAHTSLVGDVLTRGGITEFYDATQLVVSDVEDVSDLADGQVTVDVWTRLRY